MADFIVGGLLGITVLLVIRKMIKDRKSGRNCCGCGCEGCNGCDRK